MYILYVCDAFDYYILEIYTYMAFKMKYVMIYLTSRFKFHVTVRFEWEKNKNIKSENVLRKIKKGCAEYQIS